MCVRDSNILVSACALQCGFVDPEEVVLHDHNGATFKNKVT